jgi:hypothetical protein
MCARTQRNNTPILLKEVFARFLFLPIVHIGIFCRGSSGRIFAFSLQSWDCPLVQQIMPDISQFRDVGCRQQHNKKIDQCIQS